MMQQMERLQRMQALLCRQSMEGPLLPEEEQELNALRHLLSDPQPEPPAEPTLTELTEYVLSVRARSDLMNRDLQVLMERIKAPSLRSNLLHFFRGYAAAILTLPLLAAMGVGCLWLARWLEQSAGLPLPLTLGALGCLAVGGVAFACAGPMTRLLFRWISEQEDNKEP